MSGAGAGAGDALVLVLQRLREAGDIHPFKLFPARCNSFSKSFRRLQAMCLKRSRPWYIVESRRVKDGRCLHNALNDISTRHKQVKNIAH